MNLSPQLDPAVSVLSQTLLQALFEIRGFQSAHPKAAKQLESIEALVVAGALSPQTSASLRKHQIRFHGFPGQIRPDIAVLEVALDLCHLVGFADGHVELVNAAAPVCPT